MPATGLVKCADPECPSRGRCWRHRAPDQGAEQWWRDYHRPDGAERCGHFIDPPLAAIDDDPAPPPAARSRVRRRWRPRRLGEVLMALLPAVALMGVGGLVEIGTLITGQRGEGLIIGIVGGLLTFATVAGLLIRWFLRH
ncbi:MAG TPA: hypothetical protein VEB64_06435 [Azospirillaceae bacterium]|nr:hypothetical protein [Azospirillaceae bacterium]